MLRNSILGILALFVIVAVSADKPEPVLAHASCNPHSSSWGESRVDLNGDGDQNDPGEYKRVTSEGNNQPPGTTRLDAVVGMTNQGGATWRDNRGNTITIGFTTHPRGNPPGSLAGECGGYVGSGTQPSVSSPQTITASTTSVSFTSYVRVCTDISGCGGNYNLGPSIGVTTMSAPTPPPPTTTPPPAGQAPVLTVTNICQGSSSVFQLSWTATPTNGYALFQNGTQYATVPATQLSSTTGAANPGQTFNYFVEAINTTGRLRSNTVTITARNCATTTPPPTVTPPPPPPPPSVAPTPPPAPPPPPPQPLALTLNASPGCTGSTTQNGLLWSGTGTGSSYTVIRDGSIIYSQIINSAHSQASYTDRAITTGTSYRYQVIARLGTRTGLSNAVNVTATNCAPTTTPPPPAAPPPSPPPPPPPTCNPTNIISWPLVSGAISYEVYRTDKSGPFVIVNGPSAVDTDLVPGQRASYYVIAKAATRTSPRSNTITITADSCVPETPTLRRVTTNCPCAIP